MNKCRVHHSSAAVNVIATQREHGGGIVLVFGTLAGSIGSRPERIPQVSGGGRGAGAGPAFFKRREGHITRAAHPGEH